MVYLILHIAFCWSSPTFSHTAAVGHFKQKNVVTHTHTHTDRKVNRKHVWPPEGPRCRFPKEESLILFFFWFIFFIKEKSRWTFFLPNVWNSFFSLFCYLSQSSTRVVSGVKADVWPMEWPVGKFFIIIYWKLFRHVLRPYRVVKLLSKSYLLFL